MGSAANIIGALGAGYLGYLKGADQREEREERDRKRQVEADRMERRSRLQKRIGAFKNPGQNQQKGLGGKPVAAYGVIQSEGPEYRTPSVDEAAGLYHDTMMDIAGDNDLIAEMKPTLDQFRQIGMSQHAAGYQGDTSTPEGSLAYTRYMADGAARFGDYMTPEQVESLSAKAKTMREEGLMDSMQHLHAGNLPEAQRTWDENGQMRGKILAIEPAEFDLGGQKLRTHNVVFQDENGEEQSFNAGKYLFNMQAVERQLSQLNTSSTQQANQAHQEGTLTQSKLHQDETRTQSKTHQDATRKETKRHNKETEKNTRRGNSARAIKASAEKSDRKVAPSKDARSIFKTGIGYSRDAMGNLMAPEDLLDNQDLVAAVESEIDKLVRKGHEPGEAAKAGHALWTRALTLKKSKLSTSEAMKRAKKDAAAQMKSADDGAPEWIKQFMDDKDDT